MSTKYNGLGSAVLHTNVHGNWSTGSKVEDFYGFLPYMGKEAIWSCDQHYIDFFFISLYLKAYIQNLVKNGLVVSEKNKFLILICK